MKLKNSYILLIAMTIFLLVGIGSVCASENVTADSDGPIASADSDVVLGDGEDAGGGTTQEKTTTNITATGEKKYSYDSDKNITVSVKDNESQEISVNKDNLTVYEGNKQINFLYNSSKITILDQLSVGDHVLTINYLGNDNYNTSSTDFILKIFGNYTIEVNDTVYSDGETVEIPVKVFDGVDYVSLEKKFNVTLSYTDSTGNITSKNISNYDIEDGKIKFTPDVKLIAASVTLNYTNAVEPKTVRILLTTTIIANPTKERFNSTENKTINVVVNDGKENPLNITKADLNVLENGTNVTFEYNGTTGIMTIKGISEGAHNLTILYKGNETYSQANTTVMLNIYGKNQIQVPDYVVSHDGKALDIHIIIFNGLESVVINKTHLTLNLTYTDGTGNVTTVSINQDKVMIEGEELLISNIEYPLNKASLTIDYINSTGAKTVKINLLTTIEAKPVTDKYRYNETNNITVKVYDYSGIELTISKNDLEVFDNGKPITKPFKFNNSILTLALEQGVHNLTIVYKGNDTFNSSSTTIERKVYGDARINPSESVILDENKNATIFINLNDGADNIPIDQSKLNLTLFYTVGNKTSNRTVTGFILNNQTVTFAVPEDFDSAYVNIKYDTNMTGNTTIKVNTTVIAPDTLHIGENQVKNFTVEVQATNGHVINLTDKNIQVLKDGKALNITVNGTSITIKDALTFGSYNLTIKYLGTETYLESIKTLALNICGINATASVDVNSTKRAVIKFDIVDGNETININIDDLNLTITYKVGNDTKVINITSKMIDNGTLILTLEHGNFTTATLAINYMNGTALKNITLNRIFNGKIIILNSVNEYSNGNFTFKLVDIDDGDKPIEGKSISLLIKGNISVGQSATTDKDGIATFRNVNLYTFDETFTGKKLEVGNHTIELSTDGNVKTEKITSNLTVLQANIKIVIDPYKEYYGSDKKVKITVTNAKNGEPVSGIILHLYMPETSGKDYYFQTDANGTSEIAVKGLVGGDYEMTVSNNDTKNINETSAKTKITIVPIPVTINAKDVTVYYNTGVTQTITITDQQTGKPVEGAYVLIQIDKDSKKTYLFLTNSKGQISYSASLPVGKHTVTIATADKRYSATTVTKTIKVKKASGKITAKKVTTYYKTEKYFTVKLTNTKNKKPIYDAKVNIKIYISKNRYYNYNGKTGMNGKLKLLLSSLKPGKYKVVVSCADSKNYSAKKVTTKIVIKKAPARFISKKVTAKKGAKNYFKVTVKNKKTKKVIKGVKVKIKVYTGKKSKTYKVKTNKKGIAKLSTAKLKVGKHKVVITSANKYVIAKKAKSSIKIKR